MDLAADIAAMLAEVLCLCRAHLVLLSLAEAKATVAAEIRRLAKRHRAKPPSIVCREIAPVLAKKYTCSSSCS
jgi:hypothetical protein